MDLCRDRFISAACWTNDSSVGQRDPSVEAPDDKTALLVELGSEFDTDRSRSPCEVPCALLALKKGTGRPASASRAWEAAEGGT